MQMRACGTQSNNMQVVGAADQVINAKLLQLQHDRTQVGTQNLRVGLLLQVLLEGGLCVQPEALARLRTPGTPCSLVGTGLQEGLLHQ